MAVVTLLGTPSFDTNSGTKTVTATPAAGSLILIVTAHSGSTATTTCTDNNGSGVYVTVQTAVKSVSADTMMFQLRTTSIASATSTVFTHAPGTTTGGGLAVYQITGMGKFGSSASLQVAKQDNQTVTAAPAPVFGSIPKVSNPIIGAVLGTGTAVPRTGYTEDFDNSYITPATNLEIMHLTANEGETSATITWGGTVTQPFCSAVIELDYTLPMQNNNYQFVHAGNGMAVSGGIR